MPPTFRRLWEWTECRKESEMSTKNIGLALIVIGVIVLAVSLLADVIEIGQDPSAIGWRQLLGAAVGLIIAVIGFVLSRRESKPKA